MTKKEIFNELSNIKGIEKKSGIQLVTKCILCGDSATNPNKKRLGIKVDWTNTEEPVLYQCFNCGATGVLTSFMMRELGCEDHTLIRGVIEANNAALQSEGNVKVSRYKNKKEIKVEIPPLRKDPLQLHKVKYLFQRIGKPDCLTLGDFQKLKIVWSIKEFLYVNGIRPRNNRIDTLDEYYIGFLSANNEYIILRDITDKQKMRYIKYNIYGVYDNSNSFYTIKNQINPLIQDELHIIAAEGTFDVISILYNIFNGDDKNRIYCATCNGQYKNTLLYYIDRGLVGRNVFIDIFRDNDNDRYMNYEKLRKSMKPYTTNFTVYYNSLSKDFGVQADKIQLEIAM